MKTAEKFRKQDKRSCYTAQLVKDSSFDETHACIKMTKESKSVEANFHKRYHFYLLRNQLEDFSSSVSVRIRIYLLFYHCSRAMLSLSGLRLQCFV